MKWASKRQNTKIWGIGLFFVLLSPFVVWSNSTIAQIIASYSFSLIFIFLFLNQKQEHQQLQTLPNSDSQLTLALKNAKMAIFDWNILSNQIIWSQGYEQLFGCELGALNNSYEAFLSQIYPEDREAFLRVINRAIQEKIDYQYEFRVAWDDGSIHWLESQGKVINNEAAEVVRIMGTFRDIDQVYKQLDLGKIAEAKIQLLNAELEQRVLATKQLSKENQELYKEINERLLLEKKLYSSEEQMRGVFEAITDIVLVVDTKTGSINVAPTNPVCSHKSATDIISKTIELIFKDIEFIFNNEENKNYSNPIQQALEKQQIINFDYSLSFDDSEVWFAASISPLLDDSVIWIARDITERRAIETMKNEFISIVSHELRTPLTAIRGSLGLLATGKLYNNPQRMQRLIEIASIDTERLVRLVNDILDLERLESGKITLVKELCDVENLIQQSVETIRSLAEKDNISLAIISTTTQVWAAPDSIIQVLANLLSNAIKFSPANSAISIFAEQQFEWVLFKVKDQGRGIPSDKLEFVFKRFQQVDASDSRSKGGTGLGLAICQSIVEQHGGRIWVESVLGSGSIFNFTLPISRKEEVGKNLE